MDRTVRELHPGAWWIWALGLAAAASVLTNPFLLLLEIAVAGFVVVMRRSDQPWSRSFRLYLLLGLVIIAVRVGFRMLVGGGLVTPEDTVLIDLPRIPLPHWVLGIHLLGPVTAASILAGLYDGLRLATIVICVGAANALANPKRLLKALPPALYEIGTALVISVSVLPQLAESVQRVRRARELRGSSDRRMGRMRRIVVPVLEDALERSLALAAGMDARGYGRSGSTPVGQRRLTGGLLLAALVGIGAGSYGLLDETAPRWMSTPMLALGIVLAVGGLWSAGRRVRRTRYRADRWRAEDVGVALTGLCVGLGIILFVTDPLVRSPDVHSTPQVPTLAFLIVLIGLLPALIAPPARALVVAG